MTSSLAADAATLHRRTVETARAQLEEMADFMLRRIIERMGPTRDLAPSDVQDLRHDVARGAVSFLASLGEDRAPTRAELQELHEIGAQRARLGVLREEMLASVDIAVESGITYLFRTMSHIADEGGTASDSSALLACANHVSLRLYRFANVMKEALTLGYFKQAEQPSGGTGADISLVNTLVGHVGNDEAAVREWARQRGRVLGRWNGCLLAVSGARGVRYEDLVKATNACANLVRGLIVGPSRFAVTGHVILLATCMNRSDWGTLLIEVDRTASDLDLLVVAVGPVEGLAELRSVYERALRDLPVARAARRGGGVVESQELRLLKLLATTAPDLAMEYEDDVLRGLLARDDAAETLDILEDRSHNPAQAVAERRSIPRRTVERAVQRAARLTGLDFNLPAQRLEFEVALRLHRLRQATSETKLEGP